MTTKYLAPVDLVARYGVSYFHDTSPGKPLPMGSRAKAEAEYLADPEKAILQNVEHAQFDLRATTERFFAAKEDGLYDPEMFKRAERDKQEAWLKAMDTIRGDYGRAKHELLHWREYLAWVRAGSPTPPQAANARALAEAKAARYDRDTDDDTNAQRRAATEALAHWSEGSEP